MRYKNKVIKGTFLHRPNRFIAWVLIDGQEQACHVKNTGRCKEILLPGTTVYLEEGNNPARKTKYSLIAVVKGKRIINIDSQAPNAMAYEWLESGGLQEKLGNLTTLRREVTYGSSRFDLYGEGNGRKFFMEVKGVTLEHEDVVSFPDAPTVRGVKHINELIHAVEDGYDAYLLFVVQMSGVKYFMPNEEIHPELGAALRHGVAAGVHVLAVESQVTPDNLFIHRQIAVRL